MYDTFKNSWGNWVLNFEGYGLLVGIDAEHETCNFKP